MFGYILPYRPALSDEEITKYRSHYCGLCHRMGHKFGLMSRLSLSYDFSFLSLMYSSLDPSPVRVRETRCIFNPFKKHPQADETVYSEFCGATAVIMTYFKCRDNIDDSGFFKGLLYRTYSLLLKRSVRRAKRTYPDIWTSVSKMYRSQVEAEKSEERSLDQAADPTGVMLSYLASYFSRDREQIPHLRRFGYMLGRFIYLCDAVDDLSEDRKNGCFNPLLLPAYAGYSFDELTEQIRSILNLTMTEIVEAYRKIKIVQNHSLLDNFIYFGLDNTCKVILKKREENQNVRSL